MLNPRNFFNRRALFVASAAFVAMHLLTLEWHPGGDAMASSGFPLPHNTWAGGSGEYDFFVLAVLVDWACYALMVIGIGAGLRSLLPEKTLTERTARMARRTLIGLTLLLAAGHVFFFAIGLHGLEPVGTFWRMVADPHAYHPVGLDVPLLGG